VFPPAFWCGLASFFNPPVRFHFFPRRGNASVGVGAKMGGHTSRCRTGVFPLLHMQTGPNQKGAHPFPFCIVRTSHDLDILCAQPVVKECCVRSYIPASYTAFALNAPLGTAWSAERKLGGGAHLYGLYNPLNLPNPPPYLSALFLWRAPIPCCKYLLGYLCSLISLVATRTAAAIPLFLLWLLEAFTSPLTRILT
jgi:hypothetical protein